MMSIYDSYANATEVIPPDLTDFRLPSQPTSAGHQNLEALTDIEG
jgi:hypothetical protein